MGADELIWIWETFGLVGFVGLGIVFGTWFYQRLRIREYLQTPEGRAEMQAFLTVGGFRGRYRKWLRTALEWVDRSATDPRVLPEGKRPKLEDDAEPLGADPAIENYIRPNDPRRAWSDRLLNRCLLWAVVYPVLAVSMVWLFGGVGQIGDVTVLPDEGWTPRIAVALFLIGVAYVLFCDIPSVGLKWSRAQQKGLLQRVLSRPILGVCVVFIGMVTVIVSFDLPPFAIGVAFAGVIAVMIAGINVVTGVVALAFAGTIAVASVLAFAVAVAFADVVPSAVAGAVVTAGAFAFGLTAQNRRGIRRAYLFSFTVIILGITLALCYGRIDEWSAALLIFLGIFPLINAVFDYLSIGLTRWALWSGWLQPKKAPLFTALDLIGAAVLFGALGLALIGALHGGNLLAGGKFFDVSELMQDIRVAPQDYGWLWFMLLSTLIPTLLHLILAVLAFGEGLPGRTRMRAFAVRIGQIQQAGDHVSGSVGRELLMWRTAGLGGSLALLWLVAYAIGMYFAVPGDVIRFGFEHFAAFIGVDIVPVLWVWSD